MATDADVGERINIYLECDSLMLGDLPEIAEEWAELPEGERISWSLDWDQIMGGDLPFLEAQYRGGAMTRTQQTRYRKLLKRLKEHLPIIERLGLYPPRVPLEV